MLTCITCCRQKDDEVEEGGRRSPATKESVKNLTAQIKDMTLKASGSYKTSKPTTSGSHTNTHMSYPQDLDANYSRFARASADQVMPIEFHDEPKEEWIAQVEPGIQITFVSLPQGGNDLKRIRFSRDMFNKFEAQRWWGENYDRVMELYNVQRINRQALDTPARSDNGRDSSYSRLGSARESSMTTPPGTRDWARSQYKPPGYGVRGAGGELSSMDTTTSSRDESSFRISSASDMESEWIQEDEPGIYITIRQLGDGTRELRRVRFSGERFGEMHAKLWWDTNKERIQAEYL